MKHLNSILVAALVFLVVGVANAQDENNPWAIGVGINAVDTFPTGLRDGQNSSDLQTGELFEEFYNINDHWNILPSVSRLSVGRYIGSGFSFTGVGTINRIEKFGSVSAQDISTDPLDENGVPIGGTALYSGSDLVYYGLDGQVTYSFRDALGNLGSWLDPSLGIGGGYTWIDDIGFGTANGVAGLKIWLAENFAFDIQSTYKHNFEDFGVTHFQHSAGILFKFGGKDTDGDGVYDVDDECPETPGLAQFNGCPDTDLDGIEDRQDACPNTPGEAEFNGCPDTDGDGIADPQDACPTVAGLASMNGCPDADGDGVTDADDACPNEAGPKANKGCPWADTDGDGILDKDDKCPNEAGVSSNQGCPEPEPQVTVEIIKQLNDFSKTILFDTGKASIRQESYGTLQNIADIMKEYPNASFLVEGHTDSQGSETLNQRLSNDRAASVRTYLTTIGMSASRLSSVGYGESRPIADNKTKAGRQQNRRVEISLRK